MIRINLLPLDDLPCVLNPVQVTDLSIVVELTHAARRPAVLMAFLDWNQKIWGDHAGVGEVNVSRWLTRTCRFPLGGALRLAKVVGQPADVLFKGWT